MYYFNGHDRRLERTLQTAVMIFEAFAGFEHKYRYSDGRPLGRHAVRAARRVRPAAANEKERLKVVQRMAAHTQFCMSGDHTLEATREAIEEVGQHLDDVDEAFVFVLSDANLERYGIRPSDLADELTANPKVNAHACFLASPLGGAAEGEGGRCR